MFFVRTNIFFMVVAAMLSISASAQHRAVSREVKLDGTAFFRDLGGFVSTDYRRISAGKIFHAGDLSRLTDADMEVLRRLKVYTVIDFRSEDEAAAAPDCLLPAADYLLLSAGSADRDTFCTDVAVFREKYRPFFRKLLASPDTSAIVFHCSADMVRAGMAAALFFYAMDISPETIINDYARYAPAEFLETAFRTIERKYGSIDWFMFKELGLNETMKLRLREKFFHNF